MFIYERRKKGFAVFMNSSNIPLVDLPYSWEYKLVAENALLCPFDSDTTNLNNELTKTCGLWEYTDTINFNYSSTYRWIPIFWIRAIDQTKKVVIKLYNKSTNEVLAQKSLTVKLPKDIDIWYEYRDEVLIYYENL